jgi:ankyrin repeat protein
VEREDKEDLGAVLPGLVGAGQIQLAKQLLQWGVPVNVADDEGFTALHRAIQGNHPDLVQILLENGADVNASVKSGPYAGKTSLMMASASREGSVEPLLTRGAKVDQTDKYGATALAYAINSWNVEAIKQLASHGANLNWQNERGETYLMLAAQRAHGDTMKALLDLGANKSLKSKDGKTAGDLAKTAMTEWEKGDFFTKNPRLRSESMAVIGYASEDRDWHDAIISSAQEWLTYSPGDPEAYTWLLL